jgi:hypothetical protein
MSIETDIEKARAQLAEAQQTYDMGAAVVDNLGRTLAIARKRLADLEAKVATVDALITQRA